MAYSVFPAEVWILITPHLELTSLFFLMFAGVFPVFLFYERFEKFLELMNIESLDENFLFLELVTLVRYMELRDFGTYSEDFDCSFSIYEKFLNDGSQIVDR
jgi:hypothetical protein